MSALTFGSLLDGRVRYAQPSEGYRSGIEPVLLAAAVPAHAGERVLEAGTGAGAGLLCLAGRVRGIGGLGVERDPALAALAAHNLSLNGRGDLFVIAADIRALPLAARFDHAFANPPWHATAATLPLHPARILAKRGAGSVAEWVAALAARLERGGTLSLILPPARVPEALAAAERAACGSLVLFPLWPKQARPAKLLLLRAVRGGRSPLQISAGLILHEAGGGFTPEAEAVLRTGAALNLRGKDAPSATAVPAPPSAEVRPARSAGA